jgi:hypothetical protein
MLKNEKRNGGVRVTKEHGGTSFARASRLTTARRQDLPPTFQKN